MGIESIKFTALEIKQVCSLEKRGERSCRPSWNSACHSPKGFCVHVSVGDTFLGETINFLPDVTMTLKIKMKVFAGLFY